MNSLKLKPGNLIGLSKSEVIKKLGDQCNPYAELQWVYLLHKTWWGRKEILILDFDESEQVIGQYSITSYRKNGF